MKRTPLNCWVMTDMEGLAGVDQWEQCYPQNKRESGYQHARLQLTLEANAAVQGCLDAGAARVLVCDGHGINQNTGFIRELLHPAAEVVFLSSKSPIRWEGLDSNIGAALMIGQHAMAGTINGFLDHTMNPKEICHWRVNGDSVGEMSLIAGYAGHFGVPLVYVSGDRALGEEAARLFPEAGFTETKVGTGWGTCILHEPDAVRQQIRIDVEQAVRQRHAVPPWKIDLPARISTEWAWSECADRLAAFPNVKRVSAREVEWWIQSALDLCSLPSVSWTPATLD